MANEIELTARVRVTNGSYKLDWNPGTIKIDQSAIGQGGAVQVIGTTPELLVLGDVTNNGYLLLRNLDTTNFIIWGPDSNTGSGSGPGGGSGSIVAVGKLKPGETAILRITQDVTIWAYADSASCKLQVIVLED